MTNKIQNFKFELETKKQYNKAKAKGIKQQKMISIKVKNEILSKTTITSISYNHKYCLLAVVADASDTVAFYSFQYQTTTQLNSQKLLTRGNGFIDFHQHSFVLKERFKGQSKPPASNSISWSHNGVYIAVAGNKVQIWKFDAGRLAPFRVINQGYIDIKSIKWSDDSKFYLCYGISPKTQPISINIRNIQTSQLRQILPIETPVLCSFDPFGKYISVLNIKNKLELYDSHTLDKIRTINLSESSNDIPTLKDKRQGDWSPQYGYFVCPNLNDSRISTAVIMDRNRGFQCVSVLIGHQAVINCVKFSPNIYKDHNGKIFFILAMGDSSGCLSLWRIFYKQPKPELIFITSSPIKAEQSIQSMEWDQYGFRLIINSLKKYLTIIQFRQGMEGGDFGSCYSNDSKSQLIVGIYGARGAADIVEAKFQVFGLEGAHKADDYLPTQKMSMHTKFEQKPKQNMIKTKQEVFYHRDGNNKQKKRINPSRIIPESQAIQETANTIYNSSQAGPTAPSLKLPTIRLAPLKVELKREYKVENKKIICIERIKDMQIVSIRQRDPHQGHYLDLNTRYFNSDLKLVTVSNKQIFLLTHDKLYIFDYFLKPVQLPIYLGQITNFCSNNQGTIYYMLTNGIIRGFNFISRNNFLETSAAYLLMAQETQTIVANPFSMFVVFDDDNERLHVEMKSNLKRYFFCKQSNSWVQLDFEQGLYQLGHSLKIPKSQQKQTKKFYQQLLSSSLSLSTQKPSPITQLQSQLLYHFKYSKDNEKYKQSLIKYLLELKTSGNDEQLRRQIYKYFIDINSESYIGYDAGLWAKVVKIGGKVVEEFVIFGNQG